jgi:hypothetical protein
MTMIAGFSQPYQPKRLSQAAYSLHAACPACRSESSVRVKTIFTLLNELLQMPSHYQWSPLSGNLQLNPTLLSQ